MVYKECRSVRLEIGSKTVSQMIPITKKERQKGWFLPAALPLRPV